MIQINKTNILASLALASGAIQQANAQQPYQGVVGRTFAESKEWWPEPLKAKTGSPNVIWILIDDVGYGASSAFGGLIQTPTLDSLANNGLRYTNFHTCAISAPTRAALLTGRNSASVHVSGFSHISMSAGFPGWDGRLPSSAGTIAEVLRDNGYSTYATGKYGITPDEESTDVGPFDRWPTGKGFDHFFGFLGSQTDQYKPDLVEDQWHVTPDGRHLSAQITDKAISYIDRQKKVAADKPFFLYYAPAAVHAPHQVDKFWSDKYKGKFDKGWDVYRKEVFDRQKKLGLIPSNAILPDKNPEIKDWDKLTSDEQKLYARFFEVYAGYLSYTDYEISRLINHLKEINQLDNTLIFVSIGDNGASKEGTLNGSIGRNSSRALTEEERIQENLKRIDEIGTPLATSGNYPLGWALATNTPFRYWKQDAHSEGGTHNPLIVFYPNGIKDKGGIRNQYGHVIDILPTTLEVLGIKYPEQIRGIKQDTIQGISLAYSFKDAKAASQHTTQYYYIFGSRSIYQEGWKAALPYPNSNITGNAYNSNVKFDENAWELYNLNDDPTERINLAKKYPEKLEKLKALFEEQAKSHNLYPLVTWDDIRNQQLRAPRNTGYYRSQSRTNRENNTASGNQSSKNENK